MRKLIRITTVPLSFFGLLKGQLRFMKNFYETIGVTSPGDLVKDITSYENVPFQTVEMTRTISPLKDSKAVLKLYKLFRKEKPFIVHTHTPKAGTVGMLAAKLAGVPHRFHTVAGLPLLEATGNKRRLLNVVEKVTYSCATKIYPNSNGLLDIIAKNKFAPASKLKVIGNGSSNGIDTSYFDPAIISSEHKAELKNEFNISSDDFVYLFIGRLVGDKGVNELVSAFSKLNAEKKNIKLLLVGPLEEDLDALLPQTITQIETNKNILSTGFVKDVRPYFAISDCLVFPSYREGFPNVVMQAGSMGLPSIVSDINGCNEIVKNGVNGTIIPVKNEGAIYDEMKNYLANPKWLNQLKSNARELICNRYEQQLVWAGILEEYKNCEPN
ncbi:MAG: glycosyltransferase family 4 protein [Ginsengibacter sp.]